MDMVSRASIMATLGVCVGCAQAPPCADLVVPADAEEATRRAADLECLGRWIELEASWPEGARAEAERRLHRITGDRRFLWLGEGCRSHLPGLRSVVIRPEVECQTQATDQFASQQ